MLKEVPEALFEGTEPKVSCVAAPAFTVIAEEVTESDPPDAVMVFEPAVFSVMMKVPTPEDKVAAEGRLAAESEDVMVTVLAKEVAVFP